MRAVVLDGPGSVSVTDVPDPVLPGDDGMIVQVERTAICGSDLHLYHGHLGGPGVRLGHEFIGRVVDVGRDTRLAVGDRVIVSGVIACGRCPGCRTGNPVLCVNGGARVFGTTDTALPGGQAEAVAVPAADFSARVIPSGVSDEQAVLLTDILPTAYIGVQRAGVRPGDTVAVIGQGPVGTLAMLCASLCGAARVLAVDKDPARLAHAASLGAVPVDASGGAAVATVLELTSGRGADCVVEAVGADATITDAIMMCRAEGTVSIMGVNLNMAFPFPMAVALLRNLTVRVALAAIPTTWDALIPLVQEGRIQPEFVVSHRLGLSEAPAAYEMFDKHADGCLKVILDPTR
jgi:2-desacetyl-2-hydroxyethyl bacteriochlorophyllide A dehydrogenase